MDYGVVATNLLILFAMIGVGFIAGRAGVIDKQGSGTLTNLLMKITLPATIIASMIREFDSDLIWDAAMITIFGFAFFLLAAAIAWFLRKPFRVAEGNQGIWMTNVTFSNTGFMGFPVAIALFGEEGLFLAVMMNISFNVLMYSMGVKMVCMDSEQNGSIHWRNIIVSNINIALVIGLILFLGQIPVPTPVVTILEYLGDMTTPISMLLIGLSLSRGKVRDLFRGKDAFTAVLLRLFGMPLLAWVILSLLPFPSESLVPSVALIIVAMPAPSAGLILTEQYQGNTELASKIIFLSSLLSLISIPVMLMLL